MTTHSLHTAKFSFSCGVTLQIESRAGSASQLLSIMHAPDAEAEFWLETENDWASGLPPMRWCEEGELFEKFQLREDSEFFVDVAVPLGLDQAVSKAAENPAWPFEEKLGEVFSRDPSRRWREVVGPRGYSTVVTGRLVVRSIPGRLDFRTEFGSSIVAEVVCRKLTYFDEFRRLLDDLAEHCVEILLTAGAPSTLRLGVADVATNEAALHFHMRRIMSDGGIVAALREVFASPHVRLIEKEEPVALGEADEIDAESVSDSVDVSVLVRGGPLSRLFCGFTPAELPATERYESFDTPENRYLKAFLEDCLRVAQSLSSAMARRKKAVASREAARWAATLSELLGAGLWKEVGTATVVPWNSQVLLRKRGYKEVLGFDLSLRLAVAMPWREGVQLADGLEGDVRPVSKLYEYWCFFMLRSALRSICVEAEDTSLIELSKDGYQVALRQGKTSECRFRFADEVGRVVDIFLYYNKPFRRQTNTETSWEGSYSGNFDPDFSICLRRESENAVPHWLHFDAKYRLERRELFEQFEEQSQRSDRPLTDYDRELRRVAKRADLFKMHTYRDGILGSRGAYVLFPGDGVGGAQSGRCPNLFVRHPSAVDQATVHKVPSVGAFDLCPGGLPEQLLAIQEFLSQVAFAVASGNEYSEEEAFFG